MQARSRAARSKTWSAQTYVWLHLRSSQRRVKRLLWLCRNWVPKRISRSVTRWLSLSQPAKDASIVPSFKFRLHVHRQANCCSETCFWKSFGRIQFTLRHSQSFVVAFIEQVQNFEKSKASVFEVVQGFATVKARIQERRSDVHIIQVKSTPWKFSEGKDDDCGSFMSDVSVLYKSCISHLAKWTTLFGEFQSFG